VSKKRKNAGEGYGYMFSGAFKDKKDAVRKERSRKGSFVKGVYTPQGHRYVVMTPRTNPRKKRVANPATKVHKHFESSVKAYEFAEKMRKKYPGRRLEVNENLNGSWDVYVLNEPSHTKNPTELMVMGANPSADNPVFYDAGIKKFTAHRFDQRFGNIYASGFTKKEALHNLRDRLRDLRRGGEMTSSRGYGENPSEITVPPGTTITIRTNPTAAANPPDRYTSAHARAAGHARPLGWTPFQKRIAKMVRRASGSEGARMVRSRRKLARPSRSASKVFHELYSPLENPATCGKLIGGLPCTRKPGHRGPHLPQGATMRPKSRLRRGWQPNPSAAALRSKFTGTDADTVSIYDEPHMPSGDYAQLGELLALYFKPMSGGPVQQITFSKSDRPLVVADESARQIYFVGGNQGLPAGFSGELGECRRIDYKQRKEHVPDPDADEWRHEFGEESGIRPLLHYNAATQRLSLSGGEHRIESAGIIN